MLSKKTYYALKALVALGKAHGNVEHPVLIQTLIDQEGLPKKFLESILVNLKQAGIVKSRMGKGGGYYLARAADEIMIGSVVRVMEGPLALLTCVSQTAYSVCSHCQDDRQCGIRWLFKQVRDQTATLLDTTSLQTLVGQELSFEKLFQNGRKGDRYEI